MTMATFAAWGLRIGFGLTILTAVYGMAIVFNLVFRKWKGEPAVAPPPPNAAMELTSMVGSFLTQPPSGVLYRYEDFLEDLKNPSVSIDSVMAKCGGKIPPEWEKRLGPAPAAAQPGQIELPVVADEARSRARLEWFNKASQKTFLLKVVPPPLSPAPVPTIKAWIIHCKWCVDTQRMMYSPSSSYVYRGDTDRRSINTCSKCGGKGLVMITGG
jgi:hypothetical protein